MGRTGVKPGEFIEKKVRRARRAVPSSCLSAEVSLGLAALICCVMEVSAFSSGITKCSVSCSSASCSPHKNVGLWGFVCSCIPHVALHKLHHDLVHVAGCWQFEVLRVHHGINPGYLVPPGQRGRCHNSRAALQDTQPKQWLARSSAESWI